jgi:hypothetical protein
MTVISREELRAIKVALTDDRPYVDRISFALAVRLFEMRSSLRVFGLISRLDAVSSFMVPIVATVPLEEWRGASTSTVEDVRRLAGRPRAFQILARR